MTQGLDMVKLSPTGPGGTSPAFSARFPQEGGLSESLDDDGPKAAMIAN